MSKAYYNENDPFVAQWLRNLISKKLIAPGDVDERSIVDVAPEDLNGYTQCHFFAGIGVWSYALRLAGWPDDKPVWTGSCPCQPFSVAGKKKGLDDERHLWPQWFRLIAHQHPTVIFGEQVASTDGYIWLYGEDEYHASETFERTIDSIFGTRTQKEYRKPRLDSVQSQLEEEGYAVAAVDFPACSVGAPHIRQRIYFVADAERGAAERHRPELGNAAQAMRGERLQRQRIRDDAGYGSESIAVADDHDARPLFGARYRESEKRVDEQRGNDAARRGADGELGDTASTRREGGEKRSERDKKGFKMSGARSSLGDANDARLQGRNKRWHGPDQRAARSSGVGSFWADTEWIACRDGKTRPAKSGIFPLAHGVTSRMGRLRAYGNAIVAPQAAEFIKAFIKTQ